MRKTKSAALAALAFALLLIVAGPAAAKDRNHDGLPDRWEKKHDLSLKVKQAKRDQDRDGLRNKAEFKSGMDPRDEDSDDDGTEDGDENAGKVQSYDAATKTLTIKLFGGGTVSGLVDDDTEIECDDDGAESSGGDDDEDRGGREDDDGDHGDDDEDCGVEALTPDREVEEAELKLAGGKATFEEVELD